MKKIRCPVCKSVFIEGKPVPQLVKELNQALNNYKKIGAELDKITADYGKYITMDIHKLHQLPEEVKQGLRKGVNRAKRLQRIEKTIDRLDRQIKERLKEI